MKVFAFVGFETEFLYVALVVLGLGSVDQAVLEFTEILQLLPSECWD